MELESYLPVNVLLQSASSGEKNQVFFGFAGSTPGETAFGKKNGEINYTILDGGRHHIHVSLGKKEDFSVNTLRAAGGLLARWLTTYEIARAELDFGKTPFADTPAALASLVEGLEAGGYKFTTFKTGKEATKVRPTLTIAAGGEVNKLDGEVNRALQVTAAVNLAREWANQPANVINPVSLRRMAAELFEGTSVAVKIVDEKQLAEMGAGGILSVGKGSATPPCFIVLSYPGTISGKNPVALVGKTITFDTGGYSLKDSHNILHMKLDKCGGMDVIGLLLAADRIKLATPLVGLIPAAENMISAQAYRPDDIITTLSGKTIEIGSTDAEGRLILADALTYAQNEYNPTVMIDLATLTGGVLVALGRVRAGLMANNDELAKALFEAGERTHERLWRLPMDKEYSEMMEGEEADLKNVSGSREASTITGGTFLKAFVADDVPWAHIDIAGTGDSEKETPISVKGATGFGIRMLLDYLQNI